MDLKKFILIVSVFFIIISLSINIKHSKYLINKIKLKDINNYIEHKSNTKYFALLEISKINLKQGIIKNDNVDMGIEVINYNQVPEGNIILAAHSGNCDVCYFNNLEKLEINDEIRFYYQKKVYIYYIITIDLKRKGSFKVDNSLQTITLITCKKNSKNLQIIVTGKLKAINNF